MVWIILVRLKPVPISQQTVIEGGLLWPVIFNQKVIVVVITIDVVKIVFLLKQPTKLLGIHSGLFLSRKLVFVQINNDRSKNYVVDYYYGTFDD